MFKLISLHMQCTVFLVNFTVGWPDFSRKKIIAKFVHFVRKKTNKLQSSTTIYARTYQFPNFNVTNFSVYFTLIYKAYQTIIYKNVRTLQYSELWVCELCSLYCNNILFSENAHVKITFVPLFYNHTFLCCCLLRL